MVSKVRLLKYFLLGVLGWVLIATLLPDVADWTVGSQLWNGRQVSAAYAQADPTATSDPSSAESSEASGSSSLGEGLTPFAEAIAGLQKQEGLFTVYRNPELKKIYLALLPEQLNRNFLLVATLESGLGEIGLYRGEPINDLLIQFRDAPDNKLQLVVPNTFIRNPTGQDWQQQLLDSSFGDSVIFAVDKVSVDPETRAVLIDLSDLLLDSDVANLSSQLGWATRGYRKSSEISSVTGVSLFKHNLEVGSTVGFSSDGSSPASASLFGGLPDARGFTLGIRYSFSRLPEDNGYQPRLADERVGYFMSVFRAPPRVGRADPIVRYINRWHLEKAEPNAAISAPKQPIVFWLENTIPPQYRETVREGVLLWNEAFEQAGFRDAIAVEQMPSNASWDPADVRYNVIRWSDSLRSAFSGKGPSRVNPLTGEILDADVLIDANAVLSAQRRYEAVTTRGGGAAATYLRFCGGRSQSWYLQWLARQQFGEAFAEDAEETPAHEVCGRYVAREHAAFGSLALSVLPNFSASQLETYVRQYLTMLVAHEVGHVLGLRHNFAGSSLLPPAQLNSPELTRTRGFVSSVMDYLPPNIAPPGAQQGAFFPTRLGAYDRWAIQYGYQSVPSSPLPEGEQQYLQQITALSELPEYDYATDEDIADFIDPEANAWDLSSDPLQFAQWQLENAQAVWQRLNQYSVSRGEGYGSLRERVDMVFGYFRLHSLTIANYVGGQRFRRLRPWESAGQNPERTPLEPVAVAKQREALSTLNQFVFSPDAFEFSARLLNQLPPDRWRDGGAGLTSSSLDYPIYDQVLAVQSAVLDELMYGRRLARVRDLEFKTESEDRLTIAELFESVYQGIWSEVAALDEVAPEVSSLRRGLQRHHLDILSNMVLRRDRQAFDPSQSFVAAAAMNATLGAPEDARVLARYQLQQIYRDVGRALSRHGRRMDVVTLAHWEDVRDRVDQVLEAPLLGS